MSRSLLILGGGYVGNRLAEKLNAARTHRTAEKCEDSGRDEGQTVQFDLTDRSTWDNLPSAETVIWTFPATPLDQVQAFYEAKLKDCKTLIVYGSSSCYQTEGDDDLVNENSPLDLTRDRVVGEEWLRKKGATVLVLSGIYGPNREPKSWLERGRITTPQKRVNLIHVDDILTITTRIMESDQPIRSERFNLADGEALRWQTIADHYQLPITPSNKAYESKRVSNEKIREWLGGYEFKPLLD